MTPPSEATLAWAEQQLGWRVVGARPLTGGLTSRVYALDGERDSCVLRCWDSEYAARAVPQEVEVLTALVRTDLPVPRLIAATDDAVLMTKVPGRIELMPDDRDDWLRQMARMLARIHAVAPPARAFESWLDSPEPPGDTTQPVLWRDAIALVAQPPPPTPTCFIHRDYQHFNLLWSGDQLTGVVDWIEACAGPPEVDVGHCRLNLALLFSPEVAERFRELYQVESGRALDPWWDVHALLGYGTAWQRFLPIQIDGRAPLDIDGMTARVEALLSISLGHAVRAADSADPSS